MLAGPKPPWLRARLPNGPAYMRVRGIVDTLHESTVPNYLDLPEGVRVAALRRPPQPSIQHVTLQTIN